jgi:hypothetical protein
MPTIKLVTQDLTHIAQSKCLRLLFGGKFAVDVVIPDQISKAMVSGDNTHRSLKKALMDDYQKLLGLARRWFEESGEGHCRGAGPKQAQEDGERTNHPFESLAGIVRGGCPPGLMLLH